MISRSGISCKTAYSLRVLYFYKKIFKNLLALRTIFIYYQMWEGKRMDIMDEKQYFLNDSLGYKLFHASRLMNSRLNRNFKEHGFNLTYEQWQILTRLYERDGQTQNDLAAQNERDQASVSRLIDNLIKRGYVKREVHPSDRRVNKIILTAEAKRDQKELETCAQKTIVQASEGLSEKELSKILSVLDKIRSNLA